MKITRTLKRIGIEVYFIGKRQKVKTKYEKTAPYMISVQRWNFNFKRKQNE